MKYRDTYSNEIKTISDARAQYEDDKWMHAVEMSFEEWLEGMVKDGYYEEIGEENNMKKWYAVLSDAYDTDWGMGSHSLDTAKWMLADAGYEDGRIAVINIEGDPVCEKILTREELGI